MEDGSDFRLSRRDFVRAAAGSAAAALVGTPGCGRSGPAAEAFDTDWARGEVAHLLPTADHQRILLKASFRRPPAGGARLHAGSAVADGVRTDSGGRFYTFLLEGLAPATEYALQLRSAGGDILCDPWPLRTFPAPGDPADRFRLLAYTCAGGPDNLLNFDLFGKPLLHAFLPVPHRRRLLARALSFGPDAAVANGDHVYWDMKSRFGWALGESPWAGWRAGYFDRGQKVLGGANEEVLVRAFGPQIADLYGVLFRSLPTFFLQDDHDYGENDEASEALRTFPADPFMRDLAVSTQRLFYPELLVDAQLPGRHQAEPGIARSYGQIRYGNLFEALLYDCRQGLSNRLDPATPAALSGFLPPDVEAWALDRTTRSESLHLAHIPSTPVLWTAGKWGEWYPDFKDAEGRLGTAASKPYWPPGWARQHDRLIGAASAQKGRLPLFMSGDLHATAAGWIHATNGQSLAANPVLSLLTGAVGTGVLGWPSKFRSQHPQPSQTLEASELVSPLEENGFSLLDFTPEGLEVRLFRWLPEQGEAAIDSLEPFAVLSFPRLSPGDSQVAFA